MSDKLLERFNICARDNKLSLNLFLEINLIIWYKKLDKQYLVSTQCVIFGLETTNFGAIAFE